MAFQVNTNVNSLNATAQSTFTQTSLASSLQKLSSGLRINSAKDDASGMAIADSLRSQANALGQAIRNANDGMGIIQIADKAMDEQVKVLDTIKTKATQAAQDGQTETTRKAIQADINRLIESLDNIAATTSYNGLTLLAGGFTNKEFQIGAYSNQTVRASIGATSSDKIGHVRTENFTFVGGVSAATGNEVTLTVTNGSRKINLESVVISNSAGTGLGVLAEAINRYSDELGGIRAEADVQVSGDTFAVKSGTIYGLNINGVEIGDIKDIKANDRDNRLVQAINAHKDTTGVEASIDKNGALRLTSREGRAINVTALANDVNGMGSVSAAGVAVFGSLSGAAGAAGTNSAAGAMWGSLTLTNVKTNDMGEVVGTVTVQVMSSGGALVGSNSLQVVLIKNDKTIGSAGEVLGIEARISGATGFVGGMHIGALNLTRLGASDIVFDGLSGAAGNAGVQLMTVAEATTTLRNIRGEFSDAQKNSINVYGAEADIMGSGVTTLKGAMLVMDIAESAIKQLDSIRADLGSVQQQMQSTINNITITQVNVKSAESGIREVDFAAESANYSNLNILAQAGSYAMSQANAVQQNILRLLQ